VRLWLGGRIIVPTTCRRYTGGNPVLMAGWFSLAVRESDKQADFGGVMNLLPVSPRNIMAQPLTWLMLLAKVMGRYLMKWI